MPGIISKTVLNITSRFFSPQCLNNCSLTPITERRQMNGKRRQKMNRKDCISVALEIILDHFEIQNPGRGEFCLNLFPHQGLLVPAFGKKEKGKKTLSFPHQQALGWGFYRNLYPPPFHFIGCEMQSAVAICHAWLHADVQPQGHNLIVWCVCVCVWNLYCQCPSPAPESIL